MTRMRIIELIGLTDLGRSEMGGDNKLPEKTQLWKGEARFEDFSDPAFRAHNGIYFDECDEYFEIVYRVEVQDEETGEWSLHGLIDGSVTNRC